jgi:HK97 family phage prohead protease
MQNYRFDARELLSPEVRLILDRDERRAQAQHEAAWRAQQEESDLSQQVVALQRRLDRLEKIPPRDRQNKVVLDTVCLIVKSAEGDGERAIEGTATTPEIDNLGDEVDPAGAIYSLPLPLLWHHDHKSVVGRVTHANVTERGISVRGRIAQIDQAGPLKDLCDTAWLSVRHGLVRALSIGFQPLQSEPTKTGLRFRSWRWLELSLVSIGANASCAIGAMRGAGR